MSTIDISGLSKASVLAALYNAAAPQGKGFLQAKYSQEEMTIEDAMAIIVRQTDFDYLNGRSLKVNLTDDQFDSWLFDRNNGGDGTAEMIIKQLRKTGATTSKLIRDNRTNMTDDHAMRTPDADIIDDVFTAVNSAVDEVNRKWQEIVADGVPVAPVGQTARQHLDWSSDRALCYFDKGDVAKAILLFLHLIELNPSNSWIASNPITPAMLQIGARSRHEMERSMKGFAA
jgi:tetratricopeptide (TPR) repeat protein